VDDLTDDQLDELDTELDIDLNEIDLDEKLTAAEKAKQRKFRRSAAGKKSALKQKRRRAKPGFKPDPKRSRAAKRSAARRA